MEYTQKTIRFLHPCPSNEELISLANRPVLEVWEMAALIQGFRPIRKIGRGDITYLDEYAVPIKKLINARNTKQLNFPIKPSQILIWCIGNEIPLPEVFEQTVRTKIFILRQPKVTNIFTDEQVRGSNEDYQRNKVKRGRKKKKKSASIRGYESDICSMASKFVLKYIEEYGKKPLKKIINPHLAKITGRIENEVDRAYTMNKLITIDQEKLANRVYRGKVQFDQKMKSLCLKQVFTRNIFITI